MIKYPKESVLVPVADIKLEDRARQDFGDLKTLAESIEQLGLIHPPLLDADNNLIAGERRIRAMQLLDLTEVPVVYREQLSESQRKEMELHENIRRLGMKWQEKTLLIFDTHKAKRREKALVGSEWFQRETGELFNLSEAHVSNALKLGECLVGGDEEVLNSKSIGDALAVLAKRQERALMAESIKRFGEEAKPPEARDKSAGGVIISLDDDEMENLGQTPPTEQEKAEVMNKITFDLGKMFKLGDCLDLMDKMKPGSVDHIVTDPPYGIPMENLDVSNKSEVEAEHDVEENIKLLLEFIPRAYRLLPQRGGFCVFWYDVVHQEKLMHAANAVGFKIQKWPLIWCKTHNCQNNSAQYNFTKATEYAMVLRKGNATLVKPVAKNFLMCDGSIERKAYSNPFAKPGDVWKFVLEHVAYQGQTILDPFAGQFSSVRAMLNLGMKPLAMELKAYHFARGVEHVCELIQEITQNNAIFENNPVRDITAEDLGLGDETGYWKDELH
jgi:ParB family chromosome partitioning protein